MISQRIFDEEPKIINANQPHMACLLLLDTSGSMSGAPINALNNAINGFKAQVLQDSRTSDILDVAIVEFNTNTRVVQEFLPISSMAFVNLQAAGGTNMSPAIETAIRMIDERYRFYLNTGTQPYKPWIVLISDGAPGDSIDGVAQRIREQEAKDKLKFFSLGVEGYDPTTLHKISGEKVMRLQGYDFSSFFGDWLLKSMRVVSMSAPGQAVPLPPLPQNVDKDVSAWGA
ncbi:vWA domain-containing protein [Breznakiellaceae bacterium SP9]